MSKEKISDVLKEAGFDVEGMINQHKDPRVGVYTLVQNLCLQRYPNFLVPKQNNFYHCHFFKECSDVMADVDYKLCKRIIKDFEICFREESFALLKEKGFYEFLKNYQ